MTKSTAVRVLVALATIFTMLGAGSAGAEPPDRASDVASHWTSERIAEAIPRDLVVDHRGLGYLRLPDGSLQPYGHSLAATAAPLRAVPVPRERPPGVGGGGGSDDTTAPTISNLSPADNSTVTTDPVAFSATVTDAESGVKSVTFVLETTGQSFNGNSLGGDTWGVSLTGFTDEASYDWHVEAKDGAKRGGNTSVSSTVSFVFDTGGSTPPPPGNDTVANAEWAAGGDVQTAAGRIYFEMPGNSKWKGPWTGYVCSGTAVTDSTSGRSIILTAAHCVYDDVNKAFARNVLFIPNQAGTSASGTDLNCNNDPLGCWAPSFGVVDADWTTRTFPDNIPWDFAYYVVSDSGAHSGASAPSALDAAVTELTISFAPPTIGDTTAAIGYSYSEDPNLMYCEEGLDTESAYGDWWLGSCELSGGSSGGPWLQPVSGGNGPIISVNSWGYTNSPGMAGPVLDSQASCLFEDHAKAVLFDDVSSTDGEAGVSPDC